MTDNIQILSKSQYVLSNVIRYTVTRACKLFSIKKKRSLMVNVAVDELIIIESSRMNQ